MVLIERTGQREILTAACPTALELGLRPGMAAAHARALVADLEVHEAQPDQDRELLERLALHAVGRWTPAASVRSEEHTSELQSLMRISYAVFCLKKKKQ